MAGLGSLYIDLVAKTGKFETDIGRAARVAERRSRAMQRDFAKVGKQVAALGTAAAIGLAYLSKAAIDSQDKISKMAQSTGISVEALSQLRYAAQISGTDIDDVGKGLARLARNASDAARGLAGPKRAFDALGISAQSSDRSLKDTDELLLEVAARFARLEDGAAKAALAQELFGRSGVALIPFLNQGRDGIAALRNEADLLGLTISTKAGKAAEEFNDNLTRLKAAAGGIVNQFTQAVLPLLVKITDGFVDTAKGSDQLELSVRRLSAGFKSIITVFTATASTLEQLGLVIGGTTAAIVSATHGELRAAAGTIGEVFSDARGNATDDMEFIADVWDETTTKIQTSAKQIDAAVKESIVFGDTGELAAAAKKTADSALGEIQKLAAGLEQQIATYDKGAQATIAYRIAQGDLAQTFADAGAAADPYRRLLAELTGQYEQLTDATAASNLAAEKQRDIEADVAAIYESTRTPLEKFNAEIERLNTLTDTPGSGLDPDTYRRAAEAAQDAFESATKSVNAFADQATRNTQDIIARNIKSGFDEGAKGIIRSFGEMIDDLVAQALAANLSKKLFGEEGLGSGGGIIGGIGSFLGGIFGGGRATGGAVTAGTVYQVHEHEFFRPKVGGDIIPLSKMPATVNAPVTQNIYVQGRPDTRTAQQMQIEAARRQRIATARLG